MKDKKIFYQDFLMEIPCKNDYPNVKLKYINSISNLTNFNEPDNLLGLINFANEVQGYLVEHEISFDKNGLPILDDSYFLKEYPDMVIPVQHWTCLCFFCADIFIYRRMQKLLDELHLYKEFMGVIEPDLTVTKDMDEEWQSLIILINQLFMAVLCVNGIKCIPNTRIANPSTLKLLTKLPHNIIYASSFLGCRPSTHNVELDEYYDKILTILPSKMILYGKKDKAIYRGLSNLGFEYRQFKDFHNIRGEICYA